MNEISLVTNRRFANSKDYLPLACKFEDHLCCAYGAGFPLKHKYTNEPIDKMYTPRLPLYVNWFLIKPLSKVFKMPKYYGYIASVKLMDQLFAKKVAQDKSKIVVITPLLTKTIECCKKAGKTIVVIAENSEPLRELARVNSDYEKFGIHNRYIYGDVDWQNRVSNGFMEADYIVTISNVSQKTFEMANYDMTRFTMISKNATNFKIQRRSFTDKRKVFVTTAFHSFIKGTQRLLFAWQKAGIKDIPLLIVGNLCEDMAEFVEKYGPFDNVEFVGHRSDLSSWYLDLDAVGILLSLSEGGSKVISEMMSFGFPMLVSPDATCDAVIEDFNGYIVDPLNEEELVNKLKYISENWEKVEQMRENCFSTSSGRTMNDWADDVAEYVISLISNT